MKSGCSGASEMDRPSLSYKANKHTDAGARDLGVLPTHESPPCKFALIVMPAQPAPVECRHKYKSVSLDVPQSIPTTTNAKAANCKILKFNESLQVTRSGFCTTTTGKGEMIEAP